MNRHTNSVAATTPDSGITSNTMPSWVQNAYTLTFGSLLLLGARYRDVVECVTREAGWSKKMLSNHGLGLAVHHSFMSYAAVVMDVEVSDNGELIIAYVCGRQVNPDRVRAQLESVYVIGVGIAMMSQITAAKGKVAESNFHNYLVPRINEVPMDIRVYAINNNDSVPMGGVGEPGLPTIAPALCNAIFAATGKRIRTLPIADQLKPATVSESAPLSTPSNSITGNRHAVS